MKIRVEEQILKKLCFVFLLLCIGVPAQVFASEGSLSGRVIILDAGHGIGAPGGGILHNFGYVEHQRMFLLAGFIQTELENRGATVHMTRVCHEDVALPVRPAMMNRWSIEALLADRAARLKNGFTPIYERLKLVDEIERLLFSLDLLERVIYNHALYAPIYLNYPFDYDLRTKIHPYWQQILEFQSDPLIRYNWLAISLHSNGNASPAARGADVFFSSNDNPRNVFYFANYSHQDITELFGRMLLSGISSLGIRQNRARAHHFMVIRETNIPAVLAENGFHTNANDRRLLQDNGFMLRLAVVYADTIEAYFARINEDRHQDHESSFTMWEAFASISHSNAIWLRARLMMGTSAFAGSYTAPECNLYQFR